MKVIPTYDRSTLEIWAECPLQAWLREKYPRPVGDIAETGTAVHDAISRTIASWIDSCGLMNLTDTVNLLEQELWSARPDVQPDAIAAMRKSLWAFGRFLADQHFKNILRFDGGEGDLSGQLTHEFDGFCRVTAELDLVLATPAKEVLEVIDWKSGWRHWTEQRVKTSFQFNMQSWLVFETYPDVECVRVKIWNLRENTQTYAVEFTRRDCPAINIRVRNAAGHAVLYQAVGNTPEAWPTTEKCGLCPVAMHCTAGGGDIAEVAANPEKFVDELAALEERTSAIAKALTAVRKSRDSDIETASGNVFGFDKPKRRTSPKAVLYGKKAAAAAEETTE